MYIQRLKKHAYLLTPWSRVLLEKLTGFQLVKKFPAFYGIRRFITTFKSACHLSLSCASLIQSIPSHPTAWRSILILSSYLHQCLPGFPTKTLYKPLPCLIHLTCPTHLILLDFITCTILDGKYKSLSSSLCSFFYSPVTTSLLGSNTLLNTLFSNTHPMFLPQCQWPSFTPIQNKIMVLYILIFKFLDSKLEDKRFCTEWE